MSLLGFFKSLFKTEDGNTSPVDATALRCDREKIERFVADNREMFDVLDQPWIGHGIAAPAQPGGALRLALRTQEITPEIQVILDAIATKAAAAGIEVDIRATGVIRAL